MESPGFTNLRLRVVGVTLRGSLSVLGRLMRVSLAMLSGVCVPWSHELVRSPLEPPPLAYVRVGCDVLRPLSELLLLKL